MLESRANREGQRPGLLLQFVVCSAVVWLVLALLQAQLPGIQPGVNQVVDAKLEALGSGVELESAEYEVVIVGNSRVLAGVNPVVWNQVSGGKSSILNLGIPGDAAASYVSYVETLVENGARPSHVLLTIPWEEAGDVAGDGLPALGDDEGLMELLFPFRDFPRNVSLFLIESRSRGGPVEFYEDGIATASQVVEHGGYYFIEEQSNFANDELPDDFEVGTDTAGQVLEYRFDFDSVQLQELNRLSKTYSFQLLFVPTAHRVGEYAEPPKSMAAADELLANGIAPVGPGYLTLEPSAFSDPVHLNRDGAGIYTAMLWDLVEPVID